MTVDLVSDGTRGFILIKFIFIGLYYKNVVTFLYVETIKLCLLLKTFKLISEIRIYGRSY